MARTTLFRCCQFFQKKRYMRRPEHVFRCTFGTYVARGGIYAPHRVEQNISILEVFSVSEGKRNVFQVCHIPSAIVIQHIFSQQKEHRMENKTGKLRKGSADREKYENGMLIRFDGNLAGWSGID